MRIVKVMKVYAIKSTGQRVFDSWPKMHFDCVPKIYSLDYNRLGKQN
jgi:hypothetical protein